MNSDGFDLEGSRYRFISMLGYGAYGRVCVAEIVQQHHLKERVAVKRIVNVFHNTEVAKRTYREVRLLRQLCHENIVSIRDLHIPNTSNTENFKDLYIVMDLMYTDLYKILHTETLFAQLTPSHSRHFLAQLLCGINYLHSCEIIHRDIKPANLFVNSNCHLKIGDFGMARGVTSDVKDNRVYMTQYVATRWYRAPEIMFCFIEYTKAVDIWSVGCVFVELLTGKFLFPGANPYEQLKYIIKFLGTPSDAFLQNSKSELVKNLIHSIPKRKRYSLNRLLPDREEEVYDLLAGLLEMDPYRRIKANDALQHPYFNLYGGSVIDPANHTGGQIDFSFEEQMRGTNGAQLALELRPRFKLEILEMRRIYSDSVIATQLSQNTQERLLELLRKRGEKKRVDEITTPSLDNTQPSAATINCFDANSTVEEGATGGYLITEANDVEIESSRQFNLSPRCIERIENEVNSNAMDIA